MSDVNYKSVCCEQIPDIFLDKLVAKNHFSKFGKISRFILRPKRLSCTVEYETEEQAERAMMEGGCYNGYEFSMKYAEREVGHVQNTEEWVDADVQAELDAMGGRQQQANVPVPLPANRKMPSTIPKANTWQKETPKLIEKVKNSVPQSSPKVDTALRLELEALLRQPALSAEEKYRVLDARDKLLRLLSIRQTDIAKAETRIGTCPDMCPEKERYMRDFQRQVSVFESNKSSLLGSISHRRAIKEYSRSSADQEVPLLHELRPEGVLKMTMLYLMHYIMDLLESTQASVSDWFHFVWDRTRSIRKDITQQEICSLDAVELVEQCARFHIHCGARLVGEGPSVFDKKINAENLTKCLQTLKYLYHDLRLKNIRCTREAEFRGYIVLLNLGNSNFLWEVKQLPEQIQKSKEINRAMEFYNVLQNNNYVRFFNMVRENETSYLSACILLNYFTKLRYRAMEAIVKSHNWRKGSVYLPLEYLTRILGFEDENAAVHFFGYHGLECSEERGVLLERLTPASDYTMDRALKLVESKRTTSVGECICGHPLDSSEFFEKHQPHNSFEENGILKPDAWTAEDQLRGEAAIAKHNERKNKQKQSIQQQQSQSPISSTSQLLKPQPAQNMSTSSTTNRGDQTVFKIPQVSQFSPKQQQQQQPQPFQQSQQLAQKPATVGFSLFGNQALSSFSPAASSANNNKNLFSPKSPAGSSNNSIFNSTTKSITAPGSAGGNLFTTFSTPPKAATNNLSGNIFSNNVQPIQNLNTNLFGTPFNNKVAANTATTFPHDNNNVFQYFQKATDSKKSNESSLQRSQDEALKKLQYNMEKEEARLRKLAEVEAEKQRKAEAAKAAEHRHKLSILEKNATNQTELLLNTVVEDEIAKISINELNLYQCLNLKSKQLTEEIINEFILEQVTEIYTTEYNIECHDRMLLERYFTLWLKETRKKIEQRNLLRSTPIWVSADTQEQILEKFQHPSTSLNMQMIKRYRHGEPCDFRKLLWNNDDDADLSWRQSIDICEMISKQMIKKFPHKTYQRTYFKLLFTLPDEKDEIYGFENLCNKWLQLVLRFPNNNNKDKESSSSSPSYIQTLQKNIALCVRKISGTSPPFLNENGYSANNAECDHLDGLIFFMTCSNLRQTKRRLHCLLETSNNFKKLPISFIVYGNNNNCVYNVDELIEALDLENLIEEKKLKAFNFYNCKAEKADKHFKLILQNALDYVISTSLQLNNNEDEILEMRSLQNFLETCLGEEMWLRFEATKLQNPIFWKTCNLLTNVIELYHTALEKLEKIISIDLKNAAEFPNELRSFVLNLEKNSYKQEIVLGLPYFPKDWKSKERQMILLEFLKHIKLPKIENDEPSHKNIEILKLWLLEFASQLLPNPNDEEKAAAIAYNAIKALIDELTKEDLQALEIPQRMSLISFLPVVKPFVYAQINEQLKKLKIPAVVIYKRKDLIEYLQQPWWLNYKAIETVTFVNNNCSNEQQNDDLDNSKDSLTNAEVVLKKASSISKRFEKKMDKENHNSNEINSILRQLNETMYEIETTNNIKTKTNIDYSLNNSSCLKRLRNDKEIEKSISPKKKILKVPTTKNSVNDILARAQNIIEKVNDVRDIECKLDYTTETANDIIVKAQNIIDQVNDLKDNECKLDYTKSRIKY